MLTFKFFSFTGLGVPAVVLSAAGVGLQMADTEQPGWSQPLLGAQAQARQLAVNMEIYRNSVIQCVRNNGACQVAGPAILPAGTIATFFPPGYQPGPWQAFQNGPYVYIHGTPALLGFGAPQEVAHALTLLEQSENPGNVGSPFMGTLTQNGGVRGIYNASFGGMPILVPNALTVAMAPNNVPIWATRTSGMCPTCS